MEQPGGAAAATASRAPLQRTATSSLDANIEVQGVIDGALAPQHIKESLRQQYAETLLDDGYGSVELIARMANEDFDQIFKKPHRQLIREQATLYRCIYIQAWAHTYIYMYVCIYMPLIREQAALSLREKAALGHGVCCRCVQ